VSNLEHIIFTLVFIGAILFFLRNSFRLFALLCLGKRENRFDNLWSRLAGLLKFGFGQVRVVRKKFGFNHFFIFWGFLVLIIVYIDFLINGVFPSFSLSFLGTLPYGTLLFLADIMSLVALICVLIALIRRIIFRPYYISHSPDAYLILSLIGVLMVVSFSENAAEANLNSLTMESWRPVSTIFSFIYSGIPENIVHIIARASWWIHALVLLFFLNYLPYSKHLHILAALPNIFFRSSDLISTVPVMEFRKGNIFGVSKVTHFTWKDILDFMACTECGRCHSVCPVIATDKPLNPKDLIHQLKFNIIENGNSLRKSRASDTLEPAPDDAEMQVPLINESEEGISKEALWSCTTCGACMQVCPVFIEHVPKILKMRQHLVMERSDFPEELISFFTASEQRFNPWGMSPTDRSKWAAELDIPVFTEEKSYEYLYFVSCAGAFDSRTRQVSLSVARILTESGLSWGILGNEESCCGDALRKLGNEYVFDKIVRNNIKTFIKFGVKKIITTCPHCYSTLKNDYKQFGADIEVIHHTQLIDSLIKEGKIKPNRSNIGKTVFHDSCYLGRYNKIYEEPRNILRACSNGKKSLEINAHGDNSFCCGAGGGRMWMEENIGKRINLERTQQALETNPSTIAVSCPYCMNMFEDGLKAEKVADKVNVKDIAEIVAESLNEQTSAV